MSFLQANITTDMHCGHLGTHSVGMRKMSVLKGILLVSQFFVSCSSRTHTLITRCSFLGELASAIRSDTSIHFGLYYSLFEWFNRMYLDDKLHLFLRDEYVQNKVLPELHELIETFHPDVLWSDGDWEAPPPYWNATEFIAWYRK